MEKYRPLERYFEKAVRTQPVTLTFAEIEHILGDSLPPSASKHEAFWANNAKRHVHAAAWLDTGWRVQSVGSDAQGCHFRLPAMTPLPGGLETVQQQWMAARVQCLVRQRRQVDRNRHRLANCLSAVLEATAPLSTSAQLGF